MMKITVCLIILAVVCAQDGLFSMASPEANFLANIASQLKISQSKGKFHFDISNTVKNFDVLAKLIPETMATSPLLSDAFKAAANRNILVKLIVELTQGRKPSLFDIMSIPQSRIEDPVQSIGRAIEDESHRFMNPQKPVLPAIVQRFTGKNMLLFSNGKYSVSDNTAINVPVQKVFTTLALALKNLQPAVSIYRNLDSRSMNFDAFASDLLKVDFTIDKGLSPSGSNGQLTAEENAKELQTFSHFIDFLEKATGQVRLKGGFQDFYMLAGSGLPEVLEKLQKVLCILTGCPGK